MSNTSTPLALRCEKAINEKKSFTVQENNEKYSVSPETAKKYMDARELLSVPARIKLNTLPVKNQLALVDLLDVFEAEVENAN
jgi:hypothetical protein